MIPKRAFWFTAGVVSGVSGAVWSYARVRELRGRYEADQVADTLLSITRSMRRSVEATVREAVHEGHAAMLDAERRIEADTNRFTRSANSA